MFGLFFFIVGYARFRNDLAIASATCSWVELAESFPSLAYLVASLAGAW